VPNLNQNSDAELVKLLKANDMTGFDKLYRKYSHKLFQFAFGILKSGTDAEEIVHEVFIKVWENRNKIDEYLSFESYLFTITYNTSISLFRKKLREASFVNHLKSIQEPLQQNSVTDEIEFSELKEKAEGVIDQLPERQKQIYLLSREDGLSYRKIADKLSISVNTVENHMVKALRFLREKLGGLSVMSLLFYYLFL